MSEMEIEAGTDHGTENRGTEAVEMETASRQRAQELAPALEALIFASVDPLTLEDLRMALPEEDRSVAEAALASLEESYRREPRGLQLLRVAGGYRMATRPEYDRHLRALHRQRNRHRLGRAALETLAVIAYRQPITSPEIGEIRGKDPGGVLKTLLEKKLIRSQGRKRVVGKPFLYATTREFLMHFGLDSLKDLPSMEEFNAMIAEPELPLDPNVVLEATGDRDVLPDPEPVPLREASTSETSEPPESLEPAEPGEV